MVLVSRRTNCTAASLVLAAAHIAELIATAAGHMVTTFRFLHPEPTLLATFGSNRLCPVHKLLIFWQALSISPVEICYLKLLALFFKLLLVLFARSTNMPRHIITLETVFDAAGWAVVISLVIILFYKHIVAAICGALLQHTWVLISYLFPFKFLASFHFFVGEELLEIRQRYGYLATWLRARYR